MWIVSGIIDVPVCLAAPLLVDPSLLPTKRSQIQLFQDFAVLFAPEKCLVAFPITRILRHEQVLFLHVGSSRKRVAIVNKYAHSNIISSLSDPQQDETSDTDAGDQV